jgi:hypothetical protein
VDGATGGCEAQGVCPIRGRWDPVNDAIRDALTGITLDRMDVPCCGTTPSFERDLPGNVPASAILAAE